MKTYYSPFHHQHDVVALVDQARTVHIDGWHFNFMQGRVERHPLPWSYKDLARPLVQASRCVLDVDTGGGELLTALQPPSGSLAVEDWEPNIPLARKALAPLGVQVKSRANGRLPAQDQQFDLVLNSHGDLDLPEAYRVLASGGVLFTQQVGHDNEIELSQWFGGAPSDFPNVVRDLPSLKERAQAAGLAVDLAAQAVTTTRYLDVGAVVLQLRAVPWQYPAFDVDAQMDALERMHWHITDTGSFEVRTVRYLLEARRCS